HSPRLAIEGCRSVKTVDVLLGLPVTLSYPNIGLPVSSTSLLPFVSLDTHRIPASSSFISSRLSSLKLTSPKIDITSLYRSTSLIEPFFSKTSSKARDMGLGLHILFNSGVTGRDYAQIGTLVQRSGLSAS